MTVQDGFALSMIYFSILKYKLHAHTLNFRPVPFL